MAVHKSGFNLLASAGVISAWTKRSAKVPIIFLSGLARSSGGSCFGSLERKQGRRGLSQTQYKLTRGQCWVHSRQTASSLIFLVAAGVVQIVSVVSKMERNKPLIGPKTIGLVQQHTINEEQSTSLVPCISYMVSPALEHFTADRQEISRWLA